MAQKKKYQQVKRVFQGSSTPTQPPPDSSRSFHHGGTCCCAMKPSRASQLAAGAGNQLQIINSWMTNVRPVPSGYIFNIAMV